MKKISNEQLLFTIGAKDTASTVIKKVGQELKHLDQYQRELSKSTDGYGKSANGLRTKLDVLNRQYSAAKTGLDAYKKRMQEVQDKIDKQKQKITDLTNAEGDHSKEIESATKTLEKYKTQMHNLENNYETLQAKTRGFSNEIAKTTEALNTKGLEEYKANMIEVGQSFEDAGVKISKVGEGMQNIGEKMTVVSAAVLGAGYGIANMYMDYEEKLANISTLLDEEATNLQKYDDQIKKSSNDTGISIETVSDGMYQAISSLGDLGDETNKIFDVMVKGSKAGGAEVSDSVAMISAVMKGYGSVNEETALKVSDLAFTTARLGVTTFPELAASLGQVTPLAQSVGLSLEEMFSVYATGTGVVGNTSEVTTQFKGVLSNLMKPTTAMTELIEKYGYANAQAMIESEGLSGVLNIIRNETGGNADAMAQLFSSTEALTLVTALCGAQYDTFIDKSKQMEKSAGATEQALAKVSNTAKDRLEVSINKLKNSFLDMGEALTPMIEAVSEGISKAADAFSKLDPKVAANIVKFAALTAGIGVTLKVVGTFTSGIGSLVGGIGKGIKALANLITINSTTAAALSATGTATQGLTTSTVAAAGGFGGLSKAIGLLTNPITLAVGAIAGIGLAIYNTQKEMKENQKELDSMGNAYDDFTGRLKDDSNILGEIFGKEYEFKFSDNYKQALANSKADVQNWVEELKSYQTEIQNLLNDTSKTPEVKQAEMDEMLGTGRVAEIATTGEINPYADYLKSTYGEGQIYDTYISAYEDYIVEMKGKINANNEEIKQIITNDMAKYGEISADGMERITKLQEDNAAIQVDISKQSGEDITNILQAHGIQRSEIEKKNAEDSLETVRSTIDEKRKANEDYFKEKTEFLKNDTLMTQEERRVYEEEVQAEMNARKGQTAYMETFYSNMAMMDSDWAEKNGYNTQKIIENGMELGVSVENTATGVQTQFFNCEQSMQKWADSHGMSVTQIEGQNGKMVSVIQDGNGNIIGSVNSVADRYNLFATDIEGVMSKYTNAVNNGEMTTDQAMAAIKNDLAQGKISAEQFGMTKLLVA